MKSSKTEFGKTRFGANQSFWIRRIRRFWSHSPNLLRFAVWISFWKVQMFKLKLLAHVWISNVWIRTQKNSEELRRVDGFSAFHSVIPALRSDFELGEWTSRTAKWVSRNRRLIEFSSLEATALNLLSSQNLNCASKAPTADMQDASRITCRQLIYFLSGGLTRN